MSKKFFFTYLVPRPRCAGDMARLKTHFLLSYIFSVCTRSSQISIFFKRKVPFLSLELSGRFAEHRFPGSWIMDLGSGILDPGSWTLDPGSWIQDPGSRILIHDPGSRNLDPGSRIPGSRIQDPGSWIQDLDPGSRILDPGSRIQDPGS